MHRISPIITAAAIILASTVAISSEKPSTFQSMAGHYEAIRTALVNDSMKDIEKHAAAIRDAAKELEARFDTSTSGVPEEKSGDCQKLLPDMVAAADRLAAAKDLAAARDAFGELSKPLIRFRSMVSGERPIVVYCSMVKKPWMQPKGEIGNPYYGQEMARCGQVVAED